MTKSETKAKALSVSAMLDESELSYHTHLLDQLRIAQAGVNAWSHYLAQKYQLVVGDSVGQDGAILRKS